MKLALVGEAWGREEEEVKAPFVGASGRVLNDMLSQVGINRDECLVTNVLNLRPQPANDIKNCCGPKAEGIKGWPALQQGKYLHEKYRPELDRLFQEIKSFNPNLIVAFGATPAWALLRSSGIKSIRGAPGTSHTGFKTLPTYHPAAVMRDWSLRPIVIADLFKAKREAEFPELRRPKREVWLDPSLSDIAKFYETYIKPEPYLSVDIENMGPVITCIGFAPTIDRALVVPFYDAGREDKNYWRTFEEEKFAWNIVRSILSEPKKIVFQNGLYDMHHFWRTMGIPVPYASDDTMLLHHALQPELDKGLAFLGSIYTNEAAWKFQRKNATAKRED